MEQQVYQLSGLYYLTIELVALLKEDVSSLSSLLLLFNVYETKQ